MQWMAVMVGALLAMAATVAQAQPARGGTQPARSVSPTTRPADLARLRDLQIRIPPEPTCPESALVADVVAIDHPMVFNRIGAQNINWMMYALRHDVIDVRSQHVLDDSPEGRRLFEDVRTRNDSRGIALRPDLRPRPLVLRVAAGQYLQVRFTNLLSTADNPNESTGPVLPGLDHPLDHAPRDHSGTPSDKRIFEIDDQVASRTVGFHPQGLELVGSIHSDSSFVGSNGNSLAAPGQSRSYCFFAPAEGAFLVTNAGAVFGGEGTAGNSGVGLFATVAVQPAKARFYRAQVTEEELRLATRGDTPGGQPVIDYEATYPDDCASGGVWCREGKAGLPILNMLQGRRIVHGDINAIIVGPNRDGSFPASTYPLESRGLRNPTLPNRLEPFREFVSVYHDENAATQAFPYFFEHPELRHTLHGVRDAFMINYGSGGIGSEIIANRLQAGPMQDCLDCAYEEFFLSAFAVGDAAMLVDKPVAMAVGRCQPEFVDAHYRKSKGLPFNASHYDGFLKHCDWKGMGKEVQATQAWYPHDPANVHHSYIGDAVKFRNVHSGKEQHVFHLHNHQWLFNPNDDNSNYIDAQAIGPGSGYTYEIAFGGSGNRNKTVGDAIFHCHFYPHFAQGMWYMWRIHDVLETGTRLAVTEEGGDYHAKPFALKSGLPAGKARALPDGELVAGAPIPAIVPLPGKALPPMPAAVHVTPKATGYGSKAELVQQDETTNPGYPFWIAGVTEHKGGATSIGHRPTTPPLDMHKGAGGFDGGLPRHALAGYAEGGHSEALLTRLTAEKHLESAKPIYFPESGTPLERLAMEFHAQRDHPSHKVDMGGNVSAASFVTNGAPPVPGAPYNEPCIDDRGKLLQTGDGSGRFFGGGSPTSLVPVSDSLPGGIQFGADRPRIYKGANLQLDVVFNKLGYHYPQQRILSLWEDVVTTLDRKRPPEPLVLRMNTFDCAMYWHTNLVPKDFYADDYQITTPTDVIGQHIHLPKWDLTSADGGANGWNYEDGTFSPGAVRERIAAINTWNAHAPTPVPQPGGSTAPLVPAIHPYFNADIGHQKESCDRLWLSLGGDFNAFEKEYGAHPGICDWLGARTTLQRWFSDPVLNTKNIHRGLGITFTHDHLGPSTHQQLGLYATMLSEPPGSEWRHNETGELLGTRGDGGPTTWQAIVTGKDRSALHVDPNDKLDDSHREFFLQFGDFQHAYEKGTYVGVSEQGVPYKYDPSATAGPDSYRKAIHPSVRKPATDAQAIFKYENRCPGGPEAGKLHDAVYSAKTAPPRPCPEAISADDVGMMVVNYRNEPVAARVYDPRTTSQAGGFRGDLAYAFQTRTDRAIGDLNTQLGSTPYPPLTHHIHKGDPFTPILRAYSGDLVRVKVQAGSHEHEHNGSINGLAWLQGGAGYGQAPDSGWRNSQNNGLSEQFTFAARITDYFTRNNLTDRMYAVETAQDGIWNGVWGVLRSDNRKDRDDMLQTLPGNPRPTLLAPWQGQVALNDCPKGAPVRRYDVSAVLANRILDNPLGITIPTPSGSALDPRGGTLTYNPRNATLVVQVFDKEGRRTGETKFNAGPLHDPTAILFVRNEDLDNDGAGRLKPGRPIEPLTLRAAAGECVQIVLHNRLPRSRKDMPDLDGYTSLTGIIRDQGGSPGSGEATSFNNNDIRPSNHIALHPQMVHYDVQDYDGSVVGVNHTSTIAPGWQQVYQWYAGNVDMVGSAESCPLDETAEAGAYALLNQFPDKPTLRSLNQVYDPETFTDVLHALINPEEKLLGVEPDGLTRELATTMMGDTPAVCFDDPSEKGISVAGASPFARLPTSMRMAGAMAPRVADAVDEAPLLDATAMIDREAKLRNRLACAENSELVTLYQRRLQEVRTDVAAAEVANDLVRSFAYELPQVDNDAPFRESFEWRDDSYPGLTAETTRLARLDKLCRFNAIEYGGSNLTPPDRVKQGQKAAIGAMVVEPTGARWSEYYDDVGIDRHNPGVNQGNTRPTRTTATVHYPIRNAAGAIRGQWMRDLAVVQQKGLNFRYGSRESEGEAVPNLAAERENNDQAPQDTAPEDAHDSGHMAVNYGSEPMWYRFGLEPDAPFGKDGFAGVTHAWQAFSNSCCTPGGTAHAATSPLGEPYVPIFATTNGAETRLRLLLPTGVGRGTTLTLHGHPWARDPYLTENVDSGGWPVGGSHATWGTPSQCIGNNPMRMTLGGQESLTPMAHFEMQLPAAGNRISGDYLLRDIGGFGITSGIWALLRVTGNPAAALTLRNNCH